MTLKLLIPVLCNAVLAVILYLMEKKTPFGKVNYKLKQIIIGVLFGALAAFSTEYGIDVNGAVMNVRDASPLCAGLIFGAPAGIIAGLIGGIIPLYCGFVGRRYIHSPCLHCFNRAGRSYSRGTSSKAYV